MTEKIYTAESILSVLQFHFDHHFWLGNLWQFSLIPMCPRQCCCHVFQNFLVDGICSFGVSISMRAARSWVLILINGNIQYFHLSINIWWIVIWKNVKLPITCCTIRCLAKLWFYSFIFSKKCVTMELFLFFPDYITKIVLGYWFPKNISVQLIAKTIVDFNCKPTSSFGTCMLGGVQISWMPFDWDCHR